jgi:hypothetical protein
MTKPTGKYRLSVLVPSTAILLLVVSGAVIRRLREPVLLNSARRVANVSAWWDDATPIDAQFMVWTTDTQLFAMGSAKADESSVLGYLTDPPSLPFLYDTRNHHRTDLTRLAGQINSISASTSRFDVAPDGKHLAWTSNSPDKIDVALLDGSERTTWHVSNPTDVAWERDSKHWRALCRQGGSREDVMITASIDAPRIVTPPKPREAYDRASLEGVHEEMENEFQVDVVADQVASAVSGRRAEVRTIQLKDPEGTTINDLIVSPDGRFIAWELQSLKHRDIFWKEKLPWLNRFLGPTVRHRMELWVSKADGTDMHEIGYCPLDADSDDDSGPKLILWQPDSKHMSFVYKGFLYVVGGG